MRSNPVLKTAAALAALSFAAALAGSVLAQTPPVQAPAADEEPMPAEAGVDVAAEVAQPAGIPTGSPTPVEQAYLLKAGDPTVVSNPPVPDTPETRRAYGGPESNGGKKTRPVGN
jgi:hypothetical protein